jgi:hypothetical protein
MINFKPLTILLTAQFKEMKTFMHKKFLWTSCVLASVLLTTLPSWGVQRFIIDNNEFDKITLNKKTPQVSVGQLRWNDKLYNSMPAKDKPNHTEWIISNEHSKGHEILRGQSVEVELNLTSRYVPWDIMDSCEKAVKVCGYGLFCMWPCLYCTHCTERTQYLDQTFIGQINMNNQPKTIRISFQPKSKILSLTDGD